MASTRFTLDLRTAGMFSNVNEVIQYLHLAETEGFQFHVTWKWSCYGEQERPGNPWEYYFEQCFDTGSWTDDPPLLPVGKPVACARDNIITPRLRDRQCAPLLLPVDRHLPHRYISRYLRLNAATRQVVDDFARTFDGRRVIGVHIRGEGRVHGGAAAMMNAKGRRELSSDFERYFQQIDGQLKPGDNSAVFVCSDSQDIVDRMVERYADRVILYPATRSAFGEMHAGHARNAGETFPRFKLGQDVLVEAYLLARSDYFIHGNSNVANFVLCCNPALPSHYIYEQEMQAIIASAQ